MARVEINAEFDCPHCGAGFSIGDDAVFTDHMDDECAEKCSECGQWYQLRCASVDVEMECRKAAKPQEDQSV